MDFRIRRMDWLILRSFIGPFLASFTVILFILVLQFLSLYINEIMGKGVDIGILGQLIWFAGGRMAIMAMPVAVLAAALMTFGSMGEYYELAALKSCGVGLLKFSRAAMVIGLLLAGISMWMTFLVFPQSNLKFFSLLYDIQRKKADLALQPGYFYSDIDGYVIRISDKNKETGMLYDMMIYNHTDGRGSVDVTLADSARMQLRNNSLLMTLYHGTRHESYKPEGGEPESYKYGRTYFDSLRYKFVLEGFDLNRTDENQFRHQITLTQDKLGHAIDSLYEQQSKNRVKAMSQLGRYNKVDSTFLQPGMPVVPPLPRKDTTRLAQTLQNQPGLDSAGLSLRTRSAPASPSESPSPAPDVLPEQETRMIYAPLNLENGDNISLCFEPGKSSDIISRATVNVRAIISYIEFMRKKEEDQQRTRNSYLFEYYQRYALPINCLVFMVIGLSLGSVIRKGGLGIPGLISILTFVIFYILITQGRKLSKEGIIDPFTGAFLSIYIFVPVAIFFLWLASRDAAVNFSLAPLQRALRWLRLLPKEA
ncbi:MAG: LptF/LptG family permease [Bacteroidia bacterium]|nr:LptF/LptG family permease [Bacteroidia bacterium]